MTDHRDPDETPLHERFVTTQSRAVERACIQEAMIRLAALEARVAELEDRQGADAILDETVGDLPHVTRRGRPPKGEASA